MPAVSTRRRFLSQAAGVAAGGSILALATISATADAAAPMAALASSEVDPIFAFIARHRAEQQAYANACAVYGKLYEIVPDEFRRVGRVEWGMRAPGRPNYLHSHKEIDDCLVAGNRHSPKIKAQLHAELDRDRIEISAKREEVGLPAAEDRVEQLCDSCQELGWALANTMPTSMAGVAAVLRYANEFEDGGEEWPHTDTIGADGWHYQLRQSAARALETILTSRGQQNVGVV
jgi:hypothetical protein